MCMWTAVFVAKMVTTRIIAVVVVVVMVVTIMMMSLSFSFSSRWHRSARKGPYALRPVS